MFRRPSLRFLPFVALVALGSLTGCDETKVVVGSDSEIEQTDYIEGKRLVGEGKPTEALMAFTKVIHSRREAPESHMEAAALCLELKDPLQAIYHYRRYLALTHDTQKAPVVKDRIRRAEKLFLESLPFTPAEGSADDRIADLMEKLKQLRRENDQLKVQLSASGVTAKPTGLSPRATAVESPVATPPKPVATGQSTPVTESKRSYVIASGDTLSRISQKVYGNKNRWTEIYNANRNVMKNERDLKVGTTLVIP